MKNGFYWLLDRLHCLLGRHVWLFHKTDWRQSWDDEYPIVTYYCPICNRWKSIAELHRARKIWRRKSGQIITRVDSQHQPQHKPFMKMMIPDQKQAS